MLLFRSEEDMERWRSERDLPKGVLLSIAQQWDLARAWYANRLAKDWRRRTPAEAEEVFSKVGLVGEFWKLT